MQRDEPAMLETGSGSIVNVASISAFVGQENEGQSQYLYNISKAAVVRLSISLATRYASAGIRVNSISPGLVHTHLLVPSGRIASIEALPSGSTRPRSIEKASSLPSGDQAGASGAPPSSPATSSRSREPSASIR